MRYFYLLLLLVVVGCGSRPAVDERLALKGVLDSFFRGIEVKDTLLMRRVVTDDFVLYEEGLVWNLDSGNANIRRHLPFCVSYVVSDVVLTVDAHSGDARYLNHADFFFEDTVRASFDWVENATFRKTAGGWKMNFLNVARHKGFAAPRYDTVRWAKEHYDKRVLRFRGESAGAGGIVFLGNSLTEYGHWSELLGDSSVLNRGIAADNTFGMIDRLDEVIARKPREVFIEAGVNDVGQGVPIGRVVSNILYIIGRVRLACPGVRVFVTSLLPTNADAGKEYPEIAGKNRVLEDLDSSLRREVVLRGVGYIDLAAAVRDAGGELDHKYAVKDGVHLNDAGYAVWVGLIKKAASVR